MRLHLLVGECWVWDIMCPDACLCFLLSWVGQPALSDSKPSVECLVFKSRKSICDKDFVRNKLFYFYIWQSRKMRHKMKSWVVEKKRYTTRLQNIHSTWTLNVFYQRTEREIPVFKKFLYLPVQFILHSQKLLWDQSGCQMLLLTQVERASESSSLPQQSWSMSKSFLTTCFLAFLLNNMLSNNLCRHSV